MSAVYYKAYKVPVWVILDLKGSKLTKVKAFLDQAEARHQKWPSLDYFDFLQGYKNRGWAHALVPGASVDTQLIQRSGLEFVKSFFGPKSQVTVPSTVDRWNRVIDTAEQGTRFFDAVLEVQDPIGLSQTFYIGDHCHSLGKNTKVWYTEGYAYQNVLQKLTDKVITIGLGEAYDLDLSNTKADAIEDTLVAFFTQVLAK